MISFDAALVDNAFPLYEELFNGRLKNPNGCNISATFFVSHEYTNYCMLQTLYHQRHEIADNSISRRLPQTWWATATEEEQEQEIAGMREILRKWGNVQVEDIMGYRAPYIQVGGNTEFRALRNLGFLYESSMPTQVFRDPPLWPYTLDYQSIQDCVIEPCPTGKQNNSFNPLHPNISMHILHTVHYTFSRVLTRRICLTIKASSVGDDFIILMTSLSKKVS